MLADTDCSTHECAHWTSRRDRRSRFPSVAAAQTATWTIDPGHSAAQFSVRHMVVSNVRGEFDGPSGTVTFDPKDIAGHAASRRRRSTPRASTHAIADRDKDLRSALFFDVDKFPRITFTSKRAEAAGPGRLKVVGDLTMHGVTKEVTLDVQGPTPEIKDIWGGARVGATATTTVDRRDFGLLLQPGARGRRRGRRQRSQHHDRSRSDSSTSEGVNDMRRMWKAGVLLAAAVALYQVGAGASGSSVPAPSAPSGSMPVDADDDAGRNGARRLQQRHRTQGQGPQARTEGGRGAGEGPGRRISRRPRANTRSR